MAGITIPHLSSLGMKYILPPCSRTQSRAKLRCWKKWIPIYQILLYSEFFVKVCCGCMTWVSI